MRKNIPGLFSALLVTLALLDITKLSAQTTVTLAPVSYGTVTTGGTQVSSSLSGIEELTSRRGWFKFDLSALAGGTVISANLTYSTLGSSINSTANNNELNGLSVDPATLSGTALFSQIGSGATGTTNLFTGMWAGTHPLTLQTNGPNGGGTSTATALVTYLNSQLTALNNFAAFGLRRGSTNSYDFAIPSLVVTYMGGVACSGAPTAGTAVASASSVCPTQNVNLSLSGVTSASGLAFQWQTSPAGFNTWTDISGATNPTYATLVAAPTDFRAIVTCTNSSASDTSTSVSVTQASWFFCYCTAGSNTNGCSTGDEYISNVTFAGINKNSACQANMYADYTGSDTASVFLGVSYNASVTTPNLYNGDQFAIWIDFNQNGNFSDPGEVFTLTPGAPATGLITIPLSATTGYTRMRVRANYTGAMLPCGSPTYGEVEDYTINIQQPPSCSGTPMGGTAFGPSTICPNTTFTLQDTGYTIANGISVQWESSPTGVNMWTPITGATSPVYQMTGGIASPTDFRMMITCANGGGFTYSNDVPVNINSFFLCYCGPATGVNLNNSSYNALLSVSIPATSLSNATSSTSSNGYMQFYPGTATTTATLTQGVQYTVNVMHDGTGYYTKAWIDFDASGTFDTSEFVDLITTGSTATATFVVPLNAQPGQTGMRFRTYWQVLGQSMACTPNYDYETEDYVVTIAQAVPCSGTPLPGTAFSVASVCANEPLILQDTAFDVGLGITYQWETSPAGAGVWSPVSGATNPLFTMTGGISAPTDFRLLVTCANGGGFDHSNTISVGLNNFYNCYCASAAVYAGDGEITNVTVGSLNNNSTCAASNQMYTDFTSLTPPVLTQGTVIPISVRAGSCGSSYPGAVKAWIDFDQDGVYDNTTEVVFFEGGFNYSSTGYVASGTIQIPLTATTGITGMRVTMWEGGTNGTMIPCSDPNAYYYGETEDYLVDIAATTQCTGTPGAGTAFAPDSVCANQAFLLQDTAYTSALGISYQWEESPASANTWTPISGATNVIYNYTSGISAPTDFRLVVTCANGGGFSYSNIVTMTLSSFYKCYCASAAQYADDGEIFNVTLGTMSNTSNCTNGDGMYTDHTSVAPPSLTQGATVPISITAGSCLGSYPAAVKAWIDFDHDGIFDNTTEAVFFQGGFSYSASGYVVTGTVTIPPTAMTGITGFRVAMWEGGTNGIMIPCSDPNAYYYGETEDYLVTIAAATPCSGVPDAGVAYGPPVACAGIPFTLADTAYTIGSGITYQWQSSPGGVNTWTNISGATTTNYIVSGGIMSATDYRLIVTCTNSTSSDTSNVVSLYTSVQAPWTYDVETQPVNSSMQLSDCWFASPTPGFVYSWWVNGGPTGSANTGPNAANSGSRFFYTEASYGSANNIADLTTPQVNVSSLTLPILEFYYHFYGADINKMYISASSDGVTWNVLDSIVGQQHASGTAGWTKKTVPLTGFNTTVQVRFSALRGASFAGDLSLDDISIINAPACVAPVGLTVTNVGSSTADIGWASVAGVVGYEYAITTTGTPPASGSSTTNNSVAGAAFVPGSMTYYLHVRSICSGSATSTWTSTPFISNNDASGAVMLTVNGGCSGNPYNNSTATQSTGEPYPSCNNYSTGHHTVWFKFVAPANGAVKVSTDVVPAGTHQDTKIALFSATDSSNYSTFTIISCDEDGGVNINYNSNLYAVDLIPGNTYYVQVDGWSPTDAGTFCVTVDSLTNSMIASNAVTCVTTFQTPEGSNTAYTGWQSLVTNSNGGQLVAMVRNPAGGAVINYTGGLTVHTGAVRNHNGQYYLSRNYRINNSSATNVDVRFFFLSSELAALNAVDPAATLANMNVTRQTGTACQSTFNATTGTISAVLQTANGVAGGVQWIQVNTPGFSNFYIMSGPYPLVIDLKQISAVNEGSKNRIDWVTASEERGDRFELERSTDARYFTYLATIAAKGEPSTYSYWDEKPATGVNYYRLKMVDLSGKTSYSEVVKAEVKSGAFLVEAYPNPVGDELTVKAHGTTATHASITISDATGKVVNVINMENGMAVINMKGLAQGMYLVKYSDNTHSQIIKVNKQ